MAKTLLEQKMKELRKVNDSVTFEDSKYAEICNYIDTGDYALNLIMSGNPMKGCPSGRVILFNGESQVGKTYIISNIIKNAFLKSNYDRVFLFDSEGGALKDNLRKTGVDLNSIEHVLVDTVEDLTVKAIRTYNMIKEIKAEEPNLKFLLALDSIGALVTNKVYTDALVKDKQVSDQGSRARLVNTFIKAVTMPALRTDSSILITNHVYADPTAMYPSLIKTTSGGSGLGYEASIALQISRALEKNESAKDEGASKYNATILKFLTVKNRLVKGFYSSEMLLNFSSGPLKYFGLVNYAIKYGLINKAPTQGFYLCPAVSDKKYRLKEIITSEEIWTKILPDLCIKAEAEMAYSSGYCDDNQILDENEKKIEGVLEDEVV